MRRRYPASTVKYSFLKPAKNIASKSINKTAGRLVFLIILFLTNHALASESLPKGIITLDGHTAPPLILKDMEGDSFDLTKSRGHWVLVHFWATWCGPCRREMPTIQSLSETLSDTSIEIVLVNTAESEDTIFSFLGIVAPDLNPLLDADGLATEAWQPRGLPATFFVSPKGKLRYLALGGRDWNKTEYIQFLKGLN